MRKKSIKYLQKQRQLPSPSLSKSYTLEDLDRLGQEVEVRKMLEIEKAYRSNDPQSILAANAWLQKQGSSQDGKLKSYLYDPNSDAYNTNGYRIPYKGTSYDTLKRMAHTPVIKTVIETRKDQVASFAEPVSSEQEKGWMIRKKKQLFDTGDKGVSDSDKRIIENITKFILNGGSEDNRWDFDGFEEYIRALVNDSLVLDQVCFENVYTRGGKLVQFYPVDGSTIRLVDTSDTFRLAQFVRPMKGYWPKYCQIWMDNIYTFYYPWQLSFGVRNRTTDILNNGYGYSELEDLVNIVTWTLYGMQYNGNFFSQGSNPKGFFSIEGSVSPSALEDFKQMWRNTTAGVWNSHKIPVIETGGSKVTWTNMTGGTSKDMEYNKWMEFLTVLTCCIYKIDPSECGFNVQAQNRIFGQDGQKARLKHSQSKGLVPILKLFQRLFTKYIVEPLDDKFEFVFCGVETEDQQLSLDMDIKKAQNGFMSMQDGFKKWSGRDFNPEDDIILNSAYLQIQAQQQMQSQEGGGEENIGENSGEEDNYWRNESEEGGEEEEKGMESNPFEKALVAYLNEGIKEGM